MFGSAILDTAIGLVFVYIVFSLFLTILREEIERRLQTRSADLEAGIRQLLHDPSGNGLTRLLYNHPLIYSLYRGDYTPRERTWTGARRGSETLPSYIPARNFALALLDIFNASGTAAGGQRLQPGAPLQQQIAAPAAAPTDGAAAPASPEVLDTAAVAQAIDVAIRMNGGDPARVQLEIESWFNSGMDRVSGWYRRRTQRIILWVGFLLALACNVNTIGLAQSLAQDQGLRDAMVAEAQRTIEAGTPKADRTAVAAARQQLQDVGLPIGWNQERLEALRPSASWLWAGSIAQLLLGCWLTALAISLGAPFWFDVLNRMMVIRSTVKPHEKSPEEPSQDGGAVRRPGAVAGAPAGGDGNQEEE